MTKGEKRTLAIIGGLLLLGSGLVILKERKEAEPISNGPALEDETTEEKEEVKTDIDGEPEVPAIKLGEPSKNRPTINLGRPKVDSLPSGFDEKAKEQLVAIDDDLNKIETQMDKLAKTKEALTNVYTKIYATAMPSNKKCMTDKCVEPMRSFVDFDGDIDKQIIEID